MYGLPKNFDGRFLVNRTLELICFSVNQIYFHFDSHIKVMVEGHFAYQQDDVDPIKKVKVPVAHSNLMELLQHTILEAVGDAEGTLTLVFDNKAQLKLFDTPGYEAYQIECADKIIVV